MLLEDAAPIEELAEAVVALQLRLRRHVERREGRQEAIPRPDLDDRLAPRALGEELGEPLARPAQAQVARVFDLRRRHAHLLLERAARVLAPHRQLGRHLVPDATDDRQGLARHERHRAPRVDTVDAGPELHGEVREERPRRVLQELHRRLRRLLAALDAERESAAPHEPVEQIELRLRADRDAVQPRRQGQALEALLQGGQVELADRRERVADVHDRTRAPALEQLRRGGQGRAEVRGAARGLARQHVEDRLLRGFGRGLEARAALADAVHRHVRGDDRDAVPVAEVPQDRLDDAPAELEARRVGAGRQVDEQDEVQRVRDLEVALGLREELGQEVVALVGVRRRVEHRRRLVIGPVGRHLSARGRDTDQVEPEVGARLEVGLHEHDAIAHAARAETRPDALRARLGQVDLEGQLADARAAADRVAVLAARRVRADPLRVAHDDAPGRAGRDRVDAGAVLVGGLPLEERRVLGRALVDLLVVALARERLLLDD